MPNPDITSGGKSAHDPKFWREDTSKDFAYSSEPEPHIKRRKEILKKYPQIEKLFKPDPWSAVFGFATVVIQVLMAYLMGTANWMVLVFCSYMIGGFLNHSMVLACHELSHDQWFPKRWQNVWFGYFMNLCIGIAFFRSFKRYHLEHHSFQGSDKWDVDIPSEDEGRRVTGPLAKAIFLFFSWVPYAFRPLITRPKQIINDEILNWVIAIGFNATIWYYFGAQALLYLVLSTVLGLGLHPMSGHFVGEHFEVITGQETYSYYGPLNYLAYNVGYHNEHHDFPRVPGRLLPKVKEIAPEYYDMPSYNSWCKVLWDFIFNDKVNCFSRVKREPYM